MTPFVTTLWIPIVMAASNAAAADGHAMGDASPFAHVHPLDYAVLVGYFGVVLWIGFRSGRGSRATMTAYFRGAKNIPSGAAGISLMATRLSAVTFISLPAKAYATNWTYLLLPMSNIAVAWILTRWVIPFYARLDMISIYEYLEARFNRSVRLLGSLSFLALETARLSVLILVPALVITVVTDLDIRMCILAIGVVTTFSTVLGGIKGVVWVDVFQAFLMLLGAFLCIAIVWIRVDHPWEGLAAAARSGKLTMIEPSFDLSQVSLIVIALYWTGEIKNYIANQTNAQRFMVTRNITAARQSIWIGATGMVVTIALCMFVGTALYIFYAVHPERMDPDLRNPDALMPSFIMRELPPGLAGLTLAAIFSAAMSSLNSALNSISSVVVTDLYRPLFPRRTDRGYVKAGIIVVWIAGILATLIGLVMARHKIESLFDQLLEMLGLFGGPLGGIFLLGIFTTRGTSRGAWIGFGASCFILYLVKVHTSIHLLTYMAIGMLSCFGLGFLGSLPSPPRKDLRGLTVHTQA